MNAPLTYLRPWLIALLLSLPLLATTATSQGRGVFINGADVSFLQQVEEAGGQFYDHAAPRDALEMLQAHGINAFRLRIWHTPSGWPNGLDKTLEMARRIKSAGAQLLLDFHYSQSWADPGQQHPPPEWAALSLAEREDSVYRYTRDVIALLKAQKTLPSIVQIGNEVTCGMLWPEGSVCGGDNTGTQWDNFAGLLNKGIAGVRDALGEGDSVRIMIHIDRGADSAGARAFFDSLTVRSVPFDVIGLSYYPWWHGGLGLVGPNLASLALRYDKDILIAETAYPWTLQWSDSENNIVGAVGQTLPWYPPTTGGQTKFLSDLVAAIDAVPGRHGIGIVYWEPDWIAQSGFGSAWENLAWFDFQHELLPTVSIFEPAFRDSVEEGWNLVSSPLLVWNPGRFNLFPSTITPAYYYDGTAYVPSDTLTNGVGYWIRSFDAESNLIRGAARTTDTILLRAGWNLIGSLSLPLALEDIESHPAGLVTGNFFGFDGSYFPADTLFPGKGYWVNAAHEGKIILALPSVHSTTSLSERVHIVPGIERPPGLPPYTRPPARHTAKMRQ